MKKKILLFAGLFSAALSFGQPILEFQKIVASDRELEDRYGWAVDIDGDFAIVGAYADDFGPTNPNMGSAYIYQKTGEDEWSFVQKIFNSDQDDYDRFGWSVAIDGNYAIIGAYGEDHNVAGTDPLSKAGSAYIFERNFAGVWVQVQKIVAADRAADDEFGWSVAIHGNTAVVGAHNDDKDAAGLGYMYHAGSAYIFDRSVGGVWTQSQKIVASDRSPGFEFAPEHEDWNDRFGESVGIWNDYLVVGGPFASKAYMFERSGGSWSQVDVLTFPGISWLDRAAPVSIDGTTCVLGAPTEDTDVANLNYRKNAGGAAIFTRTGPGDWTFLQKIVAGDRSAGDHFGASVSIDGDYIVCGANQDNHDKTTDNDLENAGSAYIFKKTGVYYSQYDKIDLSDRQIEDQMGMAISVSDGTILVSAYQQDYNEFGEVYVENAGAAYFFKDLDDGACPTVFSSNYPSICEGDSYVVGGSTYTSSGTYTNYLTSVAGCDSIVTTYLTVISGDPFVEDIEICFGDSYVVGASVYTVSGTYYDTFPTDAGCDSIVQTNLVVLTGIDDNVIIEDGDGNLVATSIEAIHYQWIKCDPFEIIPWEVLYTYDPIYTGTYAVIAENETGCLDTSDCFFFEGDELIIPADGAAAIQTSCSGTFFDSGGSIGDYGNAEDGQITIAPTGATSVELTIVSFNVNGGTECAQDWMEVYDGLDVGAPLIGKYCNDNPPPATISSTGVALTIVFHSDGATVSEGFEIDWLCSDDPILDEITIPETGTGEIQIACEGTLFDSGGSLDEYGVIEDGQLTISPTGATSVTLNFISFDVEGGGLCPYDWLEIYDGADIAAPLIDKYCNSNPPPASLTSTGGSITLVFHSDDMIVGTGFEIDWTCSDIPIEVELIVPTTGVGPTQTACEGTLFDSGGSLDGYGANEDGQITIAPTGATSVEMTFDSFSISGGVDCDADYLEIYDGADIAAPLLGRYCSANPPPAVLTSTGGAVTIVFHSDADLEGSGFEMNWICDDEPIIDDSGVKESSFADLVSIYPNPTAGNFTIDLSIYDGPVQIELLNELGQVVYSSQLTNVLTLVELDALADGMYWVKLQNYSGVYTAKLFVVTR